ncbi:DUF2635 domain-containing protein [Chromobacterium haemolyticum]|uniref:DUF2635 domain-containing protein n=1 Tax=Chromobacterium fluminis TaxID=3044269 RepID=A0ABX0LEL2_9NEIS|nr:DUF2635 domain-containing protein [Chromobacterium haemolyticum]NHR08009.1 DUF2635 domain-containing protein [Chromobacterium haemolyticum]OQS36675.1 DUF2635 domain-containing protein [Chromobacterium haemolyticum]
MFVKPVGGCEIADPERGDLLSLEGRDVPENQYWLRREAEGVIERTAPPEAKPKGKG